jgi:deoxyribonuclease IV
VSKQHNQKISRPIGIHVSISGKIDQAVDRAIEAGCIGTFQIFTCSPRQWNAVKLAPEQVEMFRSKVRLGNFKPVAHMPYLPNLSSPDENFYSKSVLVLKREIARCDELGVRDLVLHFGSHMGTSIEAGQMRIIQACNEAIHDSPKSSVRLLLENASGAKNCVGSKFVDIRRVVDEIMDANRIGVCIDTCHVFAAGYDVRTRESVTNTFSEFDREVGLENLHLVHLNDSKGALGDGLDRHEHIGLGKIGKNGMSAIISSKELEKVPIVLETPLDKDGDDKLDVARAKRLIN